MSRHIHAESMAAYAADAMQSDEPWTRWEACAPIGSWYGLKSHPAWADDHQYRHKPKQYTVVLNRMQIIELLLACDYSECEEKDFTDAVGTLHEALADRGWRYATRN